MGTIVLNPGLNLDTSTNTEGRQLIDKAELLSKIEELRGQWLEACCGDLSSVTLDLAALLDDFAAMCWGVSCSKE